MIDLTKAPFHLDEKGINWVEETIAGMSLEDKIGQLFCTMGQSGEPQVIEHLTKKIKIGGIMFRPSPSEELLETHRALQHSSEIPLFIAANLEAGGNGAAFEGTKFGMPMGVAATNNKEMGYNLGKVSCSEGAAVGINWAFAPIVDIDMNFRNPITNLRTFGSKVENVIDMSSGYLRAAKEEKVAVSIKHFPGDGVDERDQHLLTSINSLSSTKWMETYGKVYQTLINEGAETVMIGHIAQPAMVKEVNPNATVEEQYTPGSLSPELLQGVLREKLGFNGLIVTDATLMVGFTSFMSRKESVPESIARGCDMFLFNRNIDEDFEYMLQGYKDGIITDERLNEALTRILGTKAALDLHVKAENNTLVPEVAQMQAVVGKKAHQALAKACAQQAITLVKDTQNLLPLDAKKHKRLFLNVIERSIVEESPFTKELREALEKEGFEVTLRNRMANIDVAKIMSGEMDELVMQAFADMQKPTTDFTEKYDAALIVANMETLSNEVDIRLVFDALGNDIPWYVKDIPTAFVSFANPYHLMDVPMIPTAINSYTGSTHTINATIDRLMGREKFTGVSPVDPFCGREDLKF